MNITRWTWRVFALGIAMVIGSLAGVSPLRAADDADDADQPVTSTAALATVTGTVSSSAGPERNAGVEFFTSCQDLLKPAGIGAVSNGNPYRVMVPAVQYRVRISPWEGTDPLNPSPVLAADSWHNAKTSCEDADVVTVTEGANTLDLVAARGATVTGTVSSSNGPVTSGSVDFYASCSDLSPSRPVASVLLEGSRYQVTVPAGQYRVLMLPAVGSGAVGSWHNAKTSCEDADVVTVTEGANTLDLVAARGATVTGTVSSSNGPVTSGLAYFFPNCPSPAPIPGSPVPTNDVPDWPVDTSSAVAEAGIQDGRLITTMVPVGQYRVMFYQVTARGHSTYSWHQGKWFCRDAELVTVTEGINTLNLVAVPKKAPSQSVKKPVSKATKGAKIAVAKRTNQGAPLTWKSSKARQCTVSKWKVTAKNKGRCLLVATAPGTPSHQPYEGNFAIRIA